MPNIGLPEIAIVLVIVLIIFGPKRLPELGRSLGRGMREFKDSVTGKGGDDEKPELQGGDQVAKAEAPASGEETAKPAGDAR